MHHVALCYESSNRTENSENSKNFNGKKNETLNVFCDGKSVL